MTKITENTLINWTKPPSETEENKLINAVNIVKNTIKNHELIDNNSYIIYGKGSYENNTNVKINSDIDIDIRYTNGFYYELPEGKNKYDFGLGEPIDYDTKRFKNDIFKVLCDKFGKENVKRKNKCINVKENTNRASLDIVPCWQYRKYYDNGNYIEGIKFISDNNEEIINFPDQHKANGINKNENTLRRYKKLVRIFKNLRYKMKEDGKSCGINISSYLLECLVYNVPNNIFTKYDSWSERLNAAIVYLFNDTIKKEDCKNWFTVSEMNFFMRGHYKWSVEDVNTCMDRMYKYMEY